MNITQEMLSEAEKAENVLVNQDPAVLEAQVKYLQNRVVLLRAAVNHLEGENASLREKHEGTGDGSENRATQDD